MCYSQYLESSVKKFRACLLLLLSNLDLERHVWWERGSMKDHDHLQRTAEILALENIADSRALAEFHNRKFL